MAEVSEADKGGKPRYHHGDLRAALLTAGEAELAERGFEGFSLRSVAKRAGVSHAAPAHHFGDAGGLLTALAAEGFRRFLAMQHAREAEAERDARSQMIAAGLGYIDFAGAHPALFRLMFSSLKPDFATDELTAAGGAAYRHLLEQVAATGGAVPRQVRPGPEVPTADVAAVWALAHGLADLIAAGRLGDTAAMPRDERDAFLSGIIARALPSDGRGDRALTSARPPPTSRPAGRP